MLYIAGTGTRQIQLMAASDKQKVIDTIIEQLDIWAELYGQAGGEGRVTVISGMAEGFDAAMAAAAIKASVPLWCYVPNRGYGNYYWGSHSLTGQNRLAKFNEILEYAEKVEYTNERLGVPAGKLYHGGVHLNFLRNQAMVDDATHLFGWVDGDKEPDGGTADCVRRWNIKREEQGANYFPPVVPIKKYNN